MKRFWDKVDKSSGKCWNWIACKSGNGYGRFGFEGRLLRAHRFSWMIHKGEIPSKMQVLHSCDNPSCVNPDHLFLGTPLDNMRDKVKKGRGGDLKGLHPGEKHGASKLKESEVKEIRKVYAKGGITLTELSHIYNISFGHVSQIILFKRWKHIK